MRQLPLRLLLTTALLAGCRFAPLPPTAKLPPGYHPFRPAGPERTTTPEELATAFGKRRGELIQALRGGSDENRAFAREELGRMGRVAIPSLAEAAQDEDGDVRGEAARALGATACEEALPPLLTLAKDEDWSVREATAEGIGRLRAQGGGDALLALLADDAWRVRLAAIRALGEIGEARAVPSLVPLARDVDEDVRFAAFVALSRIGDPAGREALIEGLDADDANVRKAAAEGLGKAGRPEDVGALADHVLDDSNDVRLAIVFAMSRLSNGQLPDGARPAVEAWIVGLGVPDPTLTYPSRQALELIGASAVPWLIDGVPGAPAEAQTALLELLLLHPDPRAIPACEAALSSPINSVRLAAVDLLGAMRTSEADALLVNLAAAGSIETRGRATTVLARAHSSRAEEAITTSLGAEDAELRRSAASLIGELPEDRRLPLLAIALERETDEGARVALVRQIGRIDSPEARDALAQLWRKNRGGVVGAEAITALSQTATSEHRAVFLDALQSENVTALPAALNAVLRDPDEDTLALLEPLLARRDPTLWPVVMSGLAKLAPQRAVVEAAKALDSGDRALASAAVQCLLGIQTPESVHVLERALRSTEMDVASAALDVLSGMPADLAAPAVLRAACGHEDLMLRSRAVTTLALWGYVGAAPRLREQLAAEEDPNVRCSLVTALGLLGDEASVPAIAEAAGSDDPRMRTQALSVLGLVGMQDALPPLIEALEDPDRSIRELAVEALGNLRAPEAAAPLVERLADPQTDVRRAAMTALARYGDPAQTQLLIDAMRDLHPGLEGDALRLACAEEFFRLGFDTLAQAEFENVLRCEPEGGREDAEAHLDLSYLLANQSDFAGAATHARARLMMEPETSPHRAEMEANYALLHGVELLQEGKEAHGRREIERALEVSGRNLSFLNNGAYYLVEAGVQLDLAQSLCEEALRAAPDEPNLLDTAGCVAFAKGEYKASKELLVRAMTKRPTSGDVPYHLARAEATLGESEACLTHLRRAVELDPSLARRASQDVVFHNVREDRRFQRLLSPAGHR